MKIKSKKLYAVILSLILIFTLSMPVLANSNSTFYVTTIKGNGVRLRASGDANGAILGLMYNGDTIDHYINRVGTDLSYCYVRRHTPSTYGWVHKDYIN
ncbi:MAG: SH3 domain-containing protein [Lachnospiraceae bacterium]|nr:SH3 domain-containing protein [Lachnospiraceae bacterium]